MKLEITDIRQLSSKWAVAFLYVFCHLLSWSYVFAENIKNEDENPAKALTTHISENSYKTSSKTYTDFCTGLLKDIQAQTNIEFVEPVIETDDINRILNTTKCQKFNISVDLVYPWDQNYYGEPTYRLYEIRQDQLVGNNTPDRRMLFEREGFMHISAKPSGYVPYIGGVKEYRIIGIDNCIKIGYSIGLHYDWQVVIKQGTNTSGLKKIHGWSGVIRYRGKTGVYHFLPGKYPYGRFMFSDISEKYGWGSCEYMSDKYLQKSPERIK
jgi:hypothetical protein